MQLVAPNPAHAAHALMRVAATFPALVLPDDVPILTPRRWVDKEGEQHGYVDPDDQTIEAFFGRKLWIEIEPSSLLSWPLAGEAAALLSLPALVHYLPAYLRALLLLRLDTRGFLLLEAVVTMLMRPDPNAPLPSYSSTNEVQHAAQRAGYAEFFEQLTQSLSDPQKAAIAEFLQTMAPLLEDAYSDNAARIALDRYWGAYLPVSPTTS